MLSTLRWAGAAANANSLADPNATFDPTLPCVSGEEAARDALVLADVPTKLIERLQKKPQEISPFCLYENASSILRFYDEDIILHVVKQEVKDNRVYKLLQRGEDNDASGTADMVRIARSSYLGKNPFGDAGDDGTEGLEPEQVTLLKSLQDRCHTYARVLCERILNFELQQTNVAEMEARRDMRKSEQLTLTHAPSAYRGVVTKRTS